MKIMSLLTVQLLGENHSFPNKPCVMCIKITLGKFKFHSNSESNLVKQFM